MLTEIWRVFSGFESSALQARQWEEDLAKLEEGERILDLLKLMLPVERLNFVVDGDTTYYFGPSRRWYRTKTSVFFQRFFDALSDTVKGKTQEFKLTPNLRNWIKDASQVWSYRQFKDRLEQCESSSVYHVTPPLNVVFLSYSFVFFRFFFVLFGDIHRRKI